jgi:hypothetical protein
MITDVNQAVLQENRGFYSSPQIQQELRAASRPKGVIALLA